MSPLTLSVRELAELVFRSGDLYPSRGGKPVEPEQGIRMQRRLQTEHPHAAVYRAEVPFELQGLTLPSGDTLTLRGRADGVFEAADTHFVEEYKCVRTLPDEPDPVDWGQLFIYCALQFQADDSRPVKGRLIYAEADEGATRTFDLSMSGAALIDGLGLVLACYGARWQRHVERSAARTLWLRDRAFPMPSYRKGQASVARRVYRSLREGEHLLLEAPTGSGKSLAVSFGALKELARDEQLFFLTSRNAGAEAALHAVGLIDPDRQHVVRTELRAKQKMCPIEGMPCSAERCPRARGYFDRLPEAVDELLERRACDSQLIAETAERFSLCPFELSLDLAIWSDVVIGDYNYIFDPVVRLNRFAARPGLKLLVDEAHQLFPRIADMLSVEFSREALSAAKASEHRGIERRARSIDRALGAIGKGLGPGTHALEAAVLAPFERAVDRLLEDEALLELEFLDWPELAEMFFLAHRWRRASGWHDQGGFAALCVKAPRQIVVQQRCIDPSPYVRAVLDEYPASVRLSATVTPASLYQRLHGCEDQPFERAESPFGPEQVGVFSVSDVSTFYRQRSDSSPQIRNLLSALYRARPGHYLVAFPSYAYLDLVMHAPLDEVPTFCQPRQGDLASVLDAFRDGGGWLGIVMGGSLGESVDFTGLSIAGVVLIGIGLPPPGLERDLQASHFETEAPGFGQQVAYTQPALAKVLQAAGRLIRDPTDRGIICLVDPRYGDPVVRQFFPAHWQAQTILAADVGRAAQRFWQDQAN